MMRRLLPLVSVIALVANSAESRVFVAPGGAPIVVAPVNIAATSLTPTLTVPSNFLGLSFDTQSDFLQGYFTSTNTSLTSLLGLLGSSGDIRVADYNDRTSPSLITPALVNNFSAFVSALGSSWTVTWGLNSTAGASAAVAEVGLFESAFGSGKVVYQIGNEPDGVLWAGNETGYLANWASFYAAIHAAYPAARFAGPDIANAYISGLGWIPAFISDLGTDVVEITQHYYSAPSTVTVQSLLPAAVLGLQIRSAQQIALASPLPARITESNTEEPGGANGVSNVAASATWAVLQGIILAQFGWAGVNVHGGPTGNFYSPFSQSGSKWSPTPIFAGMVLEKALNGAGVLPTDVQGGGSIVWGLALQSSSGSVEFLVANTDTVNPWPVQVSAAGVPGAQQSILLVQGANGNASDPSVTLGGAPIGASGSWAGSAVLKARGATVTMPPTSAALIVLQ